MKLSKYIKHLEKIQMEHGDIDKFYVLEPKSRDFAIGGWSPEVRYLSEDEPVSRSGRVSNLIPIKEEDQSDYDWVGEHDVDIDIEEGETVDWEKFHKTHTKVIVL